MRLQANIEFIFAVGLSAFIILAPLSSIAYSAETTSKKVTLAYPSFGPQMLWFLLEKDLGFFLEEGLMPEPILIRGSDIAVKGLMAGNFDYIQTTGAVMNAILRTRQPLKIVFTSGTVNFWLLAQPEIRSVKDLKGKIISISSRGSNTDLVMQEIFKYHGLNPLRDATFVTAGSASERFASLTSTSVHATLLSPPFSFKALEMGYRKLANASDYTKWPQGGLGTTEGKIYRDPQEIHKMVRASLKGLKFILVQKEYVYSKMTQVFHLSREGAIQTYEALREELIPLGYLTDEEIRGVISTLKQAANINEDIPPERVFDSRFVKQAERELRGWKPQIPR